MFNNGMHSYYIELNKFLFSVLRESDSYEK